MCAFRCPLHLLLLALFASGLGSAFISGRSTAGRFCRGRPAIAEVYPGDNDAFSIAAWLSRADRDGSLAAFLKPDLSPPDRWRAGYRAFPASSGRARSANCGINAVEGCERETRGLPAAAIFSLWKIVAQLPHLWRIFVAPILAALAMVNHSCDGLVPY